MLKLKLSGSTLLVRIQVPPDKMVGDIKKSIKRPKYKNLIPKMQELNTKNTGT